MAFTRDELAAYEKNPQKQVDDKVNPFRGATPARAADAAAVAAVAAGQNVDATPGGTPAADAGSDNSVDDDAPVVDEGDLGDQTDSGEGTSDDTAESSTADAELSGETDPNADLTGDEETTRRPAPKKGSAEERIVELNDLTEGYKIFGKQMQEQLLETRAELERLKNGGKPSAAQVADAATGADIKDEPMPDMADDDIAFDNDKYRAKMQKWVKDQQKIAAREAVREVTGESEAVRRRAEVEEKITAFAKTVPDYKKVVTDNAALAKHQLGPDAGALVAQSEFVGQLLYKFGKNVAFAEKVAKMTPAQQCAAVGEMIADVKRENARKQNGSTPNAKQGNTKSITQATPPPRVTPAGGRAAVRNVLDPQMSMDDFARQHRGSKQSARETARKLRGLS